MPRPMVIAYHLVWTGYGHWLPNDPKGSGSDEVRSEAIAELGEAHLGRRRVQPNPQIVRESYNDAAPRLKHPLLKFNDEQMNAVGSAFARVIEQHQYTCYACAILPDRTHLIVRKHRDTAEEILEKLQHDSRAALIDIGGCAEDHPVWAKGGWRGFLDTPVAIRACIRYVDRNLVKEGNRKQSWPFVVAYDGWPLHPGHNPNSPWARRLRDSGLQDS